MIIISLIPVAQTAVIFILFENNIIKRFNRNLELILIGILYGILSCLGTEFGVPISNAVLNVRDVAPLCAGLVFGGPSGIIAGIIGGIERYYSPFVSSYTRVACSSATILAGFLATIVRKYIFDDEPPIWIFGFAIGAIIEVFHMLMVFITHMSDITIAFGVVEAASLPMIVITAISLALSLLVVALISKKEIIKDKKNTPISESIQMRLLVCVFLAFLVTLLFTLFIQDRVTYESTYGMLQTNLIDIKNSFNTNINSQVLNINKSISLDISPLVASSNLNKTDLENISEDMNINEINVIDEKGIITCSNIESNINMNISSNEYLSEFSQIITENKNEYVGKYLQNDTRGHYSNKYSGISFYGGILQIGLNDSQFSRVVSESIEKIAADWHIGEFGYAIILNDSGRILSNLNGNVHYDASVIGIDVDKISNEDFDRYVWTVDGETSYVMSGHVSVYTILVIVPKKSVLRNRDISIYTTMFMEAIIFFILFIFIYWTSKEIIVKDIVEVNQSLSNITKGNLDTVVNVRDNKEFDLLSNDINKTVTVLKGYIKEAEERIDKDLEFARKIQFSVLPNVFPAFPKHKEFDIFAMTKPAKEVGGDFYDFFFVSNNRLAVVVADVSGKGIPAAMFMMNVKTQLSNFAETGMDIAEALRLTNEKICSENDAGMFVTIWIGIIDLKDGSIKFSSAGHNPAVIIKEGNESQFLKCKVSPAVGAIDGISYNLYDAKIDVNDYLFLYTDGVTEATNKNDELFGDDRLLNATNNINGKTCEQVCNHMLKEIDNFVLEAPQFDDITMLCFKLNYFKEKEYVI